MSPADGHASAAASPILLEPIEKLTIYAPNTATARITSTLSNKRGQILGYDARDGWPGWDRIEVCMPHAERQDFIIDRDHNRPAVARHMSVTGG